MKTITNKTTKPIKLRLPGDKTLFLGATRQAKVRDDALEHPPVKKLIEAGDIEVADAGGKKQGGGAGGGGGISGKGSGHGGGPAKVQSGDR